MQFHSSWQLPIKFPSSLAVKLQNFQDLLYHSNPIRIDLLGPKIKVDMTSICGNMYLYQATKFASQLKSVTHSAAAFEPLFRSYRIWRYLWFNYWTEARQNGGYWLNLRSPKMVDSVMQFLSQKSWEGLARTASVSAHAETDITCLLITNHRHFRFCARRDGNHLLVDHYQYHYRFCARKNGSRLVTNHRSQSRDEWSPYCLRNSTLTSCAHTQLAIFGNKIFEMVTSIPGSFLLWNF